MADIHQLPEEQEVRHRASEWIARLNAEDISAEERAQFELWRSAHPRHARAVAELSETWSRFTAAGPVIRTVSFAQSMNEVASVGVDTTATRSRRVGPLAWAAALALVALVSVTWLYVSTLYPATAFATAIGEHSTISLPDGSTLELNSNSRARVEYSERRRVIRLIRGEAFFKVAHDTSRPFWVLGGDSWVRAVGTAFNVDLRSNSVRVTVSEGTVKVGSANPPLDNIRLDASALETIPVSVVTAGEEIDVTGTAAQMRRLTSVKLAHTVSWRQGTLYFENQPLGEVIEELRRYTPLQLEIEGEALRQLPIGGTFEANPQGAQTLLSLLENGLGLTVRRESGRVVIEDRRHRPVHSG